jgi:hypothetical protein
MITLTIFWIVLIGIVSFVLRHGGQPEKVGLAIMVSGTVLSSLVVSAMSVRFTSVELGIVLVDMVMLVALFLLAMTSTRFWPLWATSFHCAGVTTHLAASMSENALTNAYALLQGFWAYPVLFTLFLGTWTHRHVKQMESDQG